MSTDLYNFFVLYVIWRLPDFEKRVDITAYFPDSIQWEDDFKTRKGL